MNGVFLASGAGFAGLGSGKSEALSVGAGAGPSAEARFEALLERANAAAPPAEKARKAAEEFVAIALVQPVLRQMREMNRAAPPFAPTQAEKQFQGLYDAEVAKRLVQASNFPLVDRLAGELGKRSRVDGEGHA